MTTKMVLDKIFRNDLDKLIISDNPIGIFINWMCVSISYSQPIKDLKAHQRKCYRERIFHEDHCFCF